MKALTLAMLLCAVAAPALAQPAGQSRTNIGGAQGNQTFNVKGHVSIWGSAGLDLDIIGDVTGQQSHFGTVNGASTVIDTTAYPDVYVKTQHRRYLGVGFGVLRKTEIVARFQTADNPPATVLIGHSGTTDNTFPVSFDHYKDRMVEFGIRHYMATPKRSREYFSLLYGLKTVDPIRMRMQAPGGTVTTALYGKSRVPSFGLEFGVTVEAHHIGIFLESGLRYQKRLKRDDSELLQYDLEELNNTGGRLFMPVGLGLMLRF